MLKIKCIILFIILQYTFDSFSNDSIKIRYATIVESGAIFHVKSFKEASIQRDIVGVFVRNMQGVNFKNKVIFGIGSGFDLQNGKNGKKIVEQYFHVPIYAEVRKEFLEKNFKLFVGSRIGYIFYIDKLTTIKSKNKLGGFMLEIPFGLNYNIKEKYGDGLALLYRIQYLNKDFGGYYCLDENNCVYFPKMKHNEINNFIGIGLSLSIK